MRESAKGKGAAYSPQSFDHLKGLVRLSDAQLAEHLDLYDITSARANALVHGLAEMRAAAAPRKSAGSPTQRGGSFEYDGMVLHEFYFANPERRPACRRRGHRARARGGVRIGRHVDGELQSGRQHSRRRLGHPVPGSLTDRLINQWMSLHQEGLLARCKPLLVMDVWEHAFMRDYKASERAKYVGAFFKNIDWSVVEGRLNESTAMSSPSAA